MQTKRKQLFSIKL